MLCQLGVKRSPVWLYEDKQCVTSRSHRHVELNNELCASFCSHSSDIHKHIDLVVVIAHYDSGSTRIAMQNGDYSKASCTWKIHVTPMRCDMHRNL